MRKTLLATLLAALSVNAMAEGQIHWFKFNKAKHCVFVHQVITNLLASIKMGNLKGLITI